MQKRAALTTKHNGSERCNCAHYVRIVISIEVVVPQAAGASYIGEIMIR